MQCLLFIHINKWVVKWNSNKDVMIEFMHLKKGGDEDANRIYQEFENTRSANRQKAFVKQARKVLSERAQHKQQQQQQEDGLSQGREEISENKEPSKDLVVEKDNDGDVLSAHDMSMSKRIGEQNQKVVPIDSTTKTSNIGKEKNEGHEKIDEVNHKNSRSNNESNEKGKEDKRDESTITNEERDSFEHIIAKLSMKPNIKSSIDHNNRAQTVASTIASVHASAPTSVPISKNETVKKTMPPPPGLGHLQIVSKNNHNNPPSNTTPVSGPTLPVSAPPPPPPPPVPEAPEPPSKTTAALESKSLKSNSSESDDNEKENVTKATAATKWQPKRFLTRIQEQPGKLIVNNQQATLNGHPHLSLSTKKEFVATWSLPLQYLQQRTLHKLHVKKELAMKAAESSDGDKGAMAAIKAPENLTIRDALQSLTVGLFRRGCPENGSNYSIISKQVVPTKDESGQNNHQKDSNSNEYHFEINHQTGVIYGTVPFYTPRTPGNVVLRLYFEEDAAITLATSTCIKVVVDRDDLEQTLRFILSNFKSRKGSTSGSISCIHSLASVLDQLQPNQNQQTQHQRYYNAGMDGAGRATWGCICESRKIVESFRFEYQKKMSKIEKQLEDLELEHADLEKTDHINLEEEGEMIMEPSKVDAKTENKVKELREKKNSLMGERASIERKWREVQGAFASVLSAIVNNNTASMLLKHDIVMKLRLENELWCSLCECFAPNPFEVMEKIEKGGNADSGSEQIRSIKYPHPITNSHLNRCKHSCAKMQKEILGFVPNKNSFASIEHDKQQISRGTLLCSKLSTAMERMYNAEYVPSMESIQKKARARDLTQHSVSMCNNFPQGTRVVIFGSSANGFG